MPHCEEKNPELKKIMKDFFLTYIVQLVPHRDSLNIATLMSETKFDTLRLYLFSFTNFSKKVYEINKW